MAHLIKIILTLTFLLQYLVLNSQVISQFDWDSDPVTDALIGPDAYDVSSSAFSDSHGEGGTNGLNSGLPKQDIELKIAGSPLFDVDGIDFSIDYQRDESVANFFNRGSSLIITAGSSFSVSYRVSDGGASYVTVTSGSAYSIPNDDVFRNYRFYYLPDSGYGALLVDGVEVWSNDGPDARPLYWNAAGDITIGLSMDASGANKTSIDNMIIGNVTFSPLPIELLSFKGDVVNDVIELNWKTKSELNNDYFKIEKSLDGQSWKDLVIVDGAGTSSRENQYSIIDNYPSYGLNYYRLSQTDFDGKNEVLDPISVNFNGDDSDIIIFPNPALNKLTVQSKKDKFNSNVVIFNSIGQEVTSATSSNFINGKLEIDIDALNNGIYFIRTEEGSTTRFVKAD